MVRERAQAFVVLGDAVLFDYRGQIVVVALGNRLPAISGAKQFAEAGLLLHYGVDFRDQFRRTAFFVDKIFKGAKPGDLPVEQPTKFELVVNLKTAKGARRRGAAVAAAARRRGDRVRYRSASGKMTRNGHCSAASGAKYLLNSRTSPRHKVLGS